MAGCLRGRARARRDGRAGDARAHGQPRQPLRARRSAAVAGGAASFRADAAAAARAVRGPQRDARLPAARAPDHRLRAHQRPDDPRLLPQVHRRRAHAADGARHRAAGHEAGEASAVRRAARRAALAGAARARPAAARHRQVEGREPRRRERADGAGHLRRARPRRRGAPRRRVPDRPASRDVAGHLPARQLRCPRHPPVRRSGRHRRRGSRCCACSRWPTSARWARAR